MHKGQVLETFRGDELCENNARNASGTTGKRKWNRGDGTCWIRAGVCVGKANAKNGYRSDRTCGEKKSLSEDEEAGEEEKGTEMEKTTKSYVANQAM